MDKTFFRRRKKISEYKTKRFSKGTPTPLGRFFLKEVLLNRQLLKRKSYMTLCLNEALIKWGLLKSSKVACNSFENKKLFNFLYTEMKFLQLRFRKVSFLVGKVVSFFLLFQYKVQLTCFFHVKKQTHLFWGNVLRKIRASFGYLLSFFS